MRDIMEVPLPRACSKRLMSFFTFHISIFFSASLACGALIVSEGDGMVAQVADVLCVKQYPFPESCEGIWYPVGKIK